MKGDEGDKNICMYNEIEGERYNSNSMKSEFPKQVCYISSKLELKLCPEEVEETPTSLSEFPLREFPEEVNNENNNMGIPGFTEELEHLVLHEEEVKELANVNAPLTQTEGLIGSLTSSNLQLTPGNLSSGSSSFFSSIDSESSGRENYGDGKVENDHLFYKLLQINNLSFSFHALPKINFPKPWELGKYTLSSNKTVLLDLDWTLILPMYNKSVPINNPQIPIIMTPDTQIPFVLRPGAREFVTQLGKHCEIILYSSGTLIYLNEILNVVEEFKANITHILSRNNCYSINNEIFLKSAKILENREIENIIVVDDSFWVYPQDLDNVLHIKAFDLQTYTKDNELQEKLIFLLSILQFEDVREPLRKKFHLQDQFLDKYKKLGGNCN